MIFMMIDVEQIEIPSFDCTDAIESYARDILEVGLLQPILVREIKKFRYEVIDGLNRAQAAKRAQQLDPVKAEMVNCFIVKEEEIEKLRTSLQLF